MSEEWKFVEPTEMVLRQYHCGVAAGDRLVLRSVLQIQDHQGNPTGVVHRAGELSLVLTGNPAEPDVIWLRWESGEVHTWDDDTLLESFDLLASDRSQ